MNCHADADDLSIANICAPTNPSETPAWAAYYVLYRDIQSPVATDENLVEIDGVDEKVLVDLVESLAESVRSLTAVVCSDENSADLADGSLPTDYDVKIPTALGKSHSDPVDVETADAAAVTVVVAEVVSNASNVHLA